MNDQDSEREDEATQAASRISDQIQECFQKALKSNNFRVVENPIRVNLHTEVLCLDEPGQGGACHLYIVISKESKQILDVITFQNGPINEVGGVNGGFQEDLMAIIRDRLEHFQKGDYACRDNAVALTKLEESIMWLNKRTAERERRGVEGTHTK